MFDEEFCNEVEREVGTKDGNHLALTVVYGVHVCHKRSLGITTLEEGLRPVGRVFCNSVSKPFRCQIVVVGLVGWAHLHSQAVVTPGVWTEGTAFLRVIAVDEADTTTAYTWIVLYDTFHDAPHHVGLAQVIFDVLYVVVYCHIDLRHCIADSHSRCLHATVEITAVDTYNDRTRYMINEVSQSSHHY